jgi:NADP-reducing hydrogenase subunit HndD
VQVTEGFIRIDQELCTGCGNCIKTCPSEAISGERNKPHTINEERCVNCARCVQVCCAHDSIFQDYPTPRPERLKQRELPPSLQEPLFAAYDRSAISELKSALADPRRMVLVQCGPTVCSVLAEDFGLAPGTISPGRVAAALKKLGFNKAYSFAFPAAIAVIEQASEFVERLRTGRILPLINSSCPAAVKFIEQFHPELIHYLTSCKSPHQIAGMLLKTFVARKLKQDPARIYGVSIGPCTSRKFEASRSEMKSGDFRDIDAVLTTRELAYLIKDSGIDLLKLAEKEFDQELPQISGFENVYCAPGDIAEAVLRAGCKLLGQDSGESLNVNFAGTGTDGVRIASAQLDKFEVKAAAISGLQSALPFFEAMKTGKNEIAYMEILACPMGCVSGGGQPKVLLPQDKEGVYAQRAKQTSEVDAKALSNVAQNPAVQQIYQNFFGKPCGDRSNRAIHTQYTERRLGG